jgi:hypothetical protein
MGGSGSFGLGGWVSGDSTHSHGATVVASQAGRGAEQA